MSLVSRIAEKESHKQIQRVEQTLARAPIPVLIKQYFPEETSVTIQVIGNSGGYPQTIQSEGEDLLFPLKGSCHENVSKGIKAGTKALLYFSGKQMKKGYVEIAHEPGTPDTCKYSPIRHSWAI